MIKKIKIIKEYLPIVVPLVVIITFLEKYFFFQYFNIPIYNYLDPEEYLSISIQIFIPLILLISLGYALITVVSRLLYSFESIKKKASYKKVLKIVYLSAFLPSLYIILVTHQKLSYLSFLYIGYVLAYKWNTVIHKNEDGRKDRIFIVFIFLGGVYAHSAGKVRKIIEGEKQDKTIIYLKSNEIIMTGKELFKIDETKKYLFLLNKEKRNTRILKREQIKDIYYNTQNPEIISLQEKQNLIKKNESDTIKNTIKHKRMNDSIK